ncbi:MAG: alpha-2-macroglobulin family protein [Desulfomonilaceae bacterium]
MLDPGTEQKATGTMREFRLVPLGTASKTGTVKITVEKGLSDASGRLLMQREFAYQFLSAQTISVTSFGTYYKSKTDKGLNLELSKPLEEDELMSAINLKPAVRGLTVSRLGDSRYRIKGDFELDRDYLLDIAPVVVNGGASVLAKREFKFKGPGIKPEISVRTERSVVELKSRQLLPLKLADVTKIRCKLTRIPPYLAPSISASLTRNDPLPKTGSPEQIGILQDLTKSGKIAPAFLGEFSEASEAFFAPEAKDNIYGYSLPLSFRPQPERGGIWMSALSDPDKKMRGESSKLIQITDLSISYKISAKNLLLWVTSVHTGQPVAGADLMLFLSNGVASTIGKTDQNGIIFVQDGQQFPSITVGAEATGISNRPLSTAQVTSAVAATASDACFIELNQLRLKPFGVTQIEDLRDVPDARTGYLFTERGVYRPGENVHFKFFARAYKQNRIVSPTGEKAKLEIVGPRQDVVYSKELTLSEFGTCYDSFALETFFPVGTYTLKATVIKSDDKKDEFTRTFLVQEYKRPKHFVSLSVKRGERISKEYISLEQREDFLSVIVMGEYYTGGPVKHAKVRWKATLVPSTNKVEGFDAYLFGNEDESTLFLESGESMLDAAGKLNFTIPLDQRLLTGIYGVNLSATVLDIDGEPATEIATYAPKPRYLVGIPSHPRRVQTGYASSMKVIVVDQQGKKIQEGKIEARIMQKKYLYTQKRDEAGNLKDLWEEGWMKTLTSQQSIVNGEAPFSLEFSDYGEYLVAFTYEDKTGRYSSQTLFKVGWDDYDNWIRRQAEKETRTGNQVLVSLSKKEYRAGEPVRIEFHTPRAVKKCLIALEKSGVLEYKIIDVNGTEGSYQFKASEQMQPNVYVSLMASAGREGFPTYPSQTDTDIPTVFFGYADVTILSEVQKLRLDIEPEQKELKGRPAEKKTLTFKVTDQAGKGAASELAVCVVDEAVMALTRFKTPELSALAVFNLPLSVFSGDLRLALISQDLLRMFTRPLTGGEIGSGEVAASLKIRKDFRPVAYFNPAVVTDASGRATVEFQLPDTTTAYRVYAVVCDKAAGFVSGQRNMVVTKEFFMEPSVPRFLIPGDRVNFPVVLHNKTGEKGDAALSAESSQNISVRLLQNSAKIEPWSSSSVKTAAEVTSGVENGWFRFKGNFVVPSAKYEDAIEQSLPIHSRYIPVNRVVVGSFSEKTDLSVDIPDIIKQLNPADINPADFKAYLTLSTTNWTRIAPGLKYLLNYPYGCIEQTSSGIIPLVGIRELIHSGTIPGIKIEQVDQFLSKGVERVLSMQLQGGGFSYWPGGSDTSWWGSMYATFALIEARQAGLKVPDARLKAALTNIRDGVFKKEDTNGAEEETWTREFALLNLAMGEMLSAAELEPFFRNYNSLSNEAKALLLLAAKKTQYLPQKKIAEMIAALDPKPDAERINYYDSSFREIAVCLIAAVEAGAGSKKADGWAGSLLRGLQPDGKWISTADTGWCLLALSKYFRGREAHKTKTVKIKIDYGAEKPVETTISDASAFMEVDPRKFLDKGKIHITAAAKELINYNLSVTYPDLVTDPSALSKGFTLNKKIENLNGTDEIRVGDVLRVTVEIGVLSRSKQGSYDEFEYLALEDPVPAGLVPVNSELATEGAEESRRTTEPSWREGFSDFIPTYMEFRNDGVRVFKNRAWRGQYRYSYLARAVMEGDFWMRGSRISLMYNPERFGKTEGRKVTVLPAK